MARASSLWPVAMKFDNAGLVVDVERSDIAAQLEERRDHLAVVGDHGAAPIGFGRKRASSLPVWRATGSCRDGGIGVGLLQAPAAWAFCVIGVEFGLLPAQARQVEFVAEFAAEHRLRQHVRIIEHRMDDRNLAWMSCCEKP